MVCLYHVKVGVIGIGTAKTDYQVSEIDGEEGEEYFVPIDFEYIVDIQQPDWEHNAVHAREINSQFNSSYRFRQTVFQLPFEFAKFIKSSLAANGVKGPGLPNEPVVTTDRPHTRARSE